MRNFYITYYSILIEDELFMNVIVYSPKDKEKKEILNIKVAEIYGKTVQAIIKNLKCSKEQKLKLLEEIHNSKEAL